MDCSPSQVLSGISSGGGAEEKDVPMTEGYHSAGTTTETPALDEERRVQADPVPEWLPRLGLTPKDLAVPLQMADAVAKQRVRFNRMVVRCQKHFSLESVHNARVSCRRLIARLLMVQSAFPEQELNKAIRQLKRFLKGLSALRDIQVQREQLTLDLLDHHEVSGLWIELGQKELDLIGSVQTKLANFKLRRLNRRIQTTEKLLTDPTEQLAAKATLSDAVIRALAQAYAEAVRRKEAINPAVPATIHRTRTAYKKYRYMVESLPSALGRPSLLQLSAMADYQTAMGVVQDTEVSMIFVADYVDRFPLLAGDMARYQQVLHRRLQDQIAHFLDVADALTSFWPVGLPVPDEADAA